MMFKGLAYYILMGTFCFFSNAIRSQDQRIADRLAVIYKADTLNGSQKLKLLEDLSFNEVNDYGKKL